MATELLKQASTLATRPVFHHWRTAGGAEVDLILERDGMLHPFEIKLTAVPTRRTAAGIEAFRQAHTHLRVATGALLCGVEKPRWISDQVVALPWNIL